MITAYGTIERAVQAMKEGAFDFITKPFDLDHIVLVVEKALERERLKRGLERFTEEESERYRLDWRRKPEDARSDRNGQKGRDRADRQCCFWARAARAKRSLRAPSTNWSERKREPFIAINCVGLSKELLESELFGHEKGAFTGAHQLKKGKMELADGGTAFPRRSRGYFA